MTTRCSWAGNDPLYVKYHDEEWGVPVHDDRKLFELITLEGAQAGLSWITVLRKRENYRAAFYGFNPERVARMTDKDVERLMTNEGLVRNRQKIQSTLGNARAVLAVQAEFGSLDTYLWQFVNGQTIQNSWPSLAEVPARTEISDAMSKDLQQRGFKFVGSTICYAFMQAVGMVNDHPTDCFRHAQCRTR
ncbi:MAG: DNA-3-methyladenine glycosylase I [Rhodocyclaceae bacterium]